MSIRRQILFTIAGLVIGISGTVLFVEMGFRVVNFFNPFMDKYNLTGIVHLYSAHPYLNHTITPNLDYSRPAHVHVNIPRYQIKTNALGFRFDPSKFGHKETDIFRIAVLGDSLIEGYQKEFTLPYGLAKKLAAISKADKKVEAMNFGVMSYSPLIHYVNLEKNILRYDPDLVIVHFDMTDVFDDNNRYKDLTVWDEDGNPEAVKPGIAYNMNIDGITVSMFKLGSYLASLRPWYSPYRARIWLIDHSYLFRFMYFETHSPVEILDVYFKELDEIYPGVSTVKNREHSDILEWCTTYDNPAIKEQVEFSFSILDRIHRLLMLHNTPLLIITLPHRNQLKGKDKHALWSRCPIEKIKTFCKDRKISFHCPVDEFEAALKEDKALYFSDNMHPNYAGQELWAKSLAGHIAENLLPCLMNTTPEVGN